MRPARADHAVSLLRRMATQGPAPNAMSYAATIDACAKASPSRPADALELLGHMEASNVKPDGVTYASAIHACARAIPAWTDEALRLVKMMEAAGVPPEAFAYSAAIDVKYLNNLDFGLISNVSLAPLELHAGPHTTRACSLLSSHVYRMLIGACNPLLCPIHVIRPAPKPGPMGATWRRWNCSIGWRRLVRAHAHFTDLTDRPPPHTHTLQTLQPPRVGVSLSPPPPWRRAAGVRSLGGSATGLHQAGFRFLCTDSCVDLCWFV